MARYTEMTPDELARERSLVADEYEKILARGLSLDMARGKPSAKQLDLSTPLLTELASASDCFSEDGTDCRNYGVIDGIPEAKRLMASLLDDEPETVIVFGNSSLTVMYDTIQRCMTYGCLGSTPWGTLETVKFLCPVPGYDRHFAILEQFGIEMIPIPLLETGPDMDEVERIVAADASVKGIWCVPQYSNPSGITYADETVRRLARMSCAAPDFRIFWDNAYCVHDLYADPAIQDRVLDIGIACTEFETSDRYFKFASTSKITFPGAGIAAMAASRANIEETKKLVSTQMIGSDKLNQLRHARFLPDEAAIAQHMQKHADIIRPKFELVEQMLEEGLGDASIATWTKPHGGYFISFDGLPNTAKRTVELARNAGVKLTGSGATWPYGNDPYDANIRIAPTMPPIEELAEALEVFVCCAKLAALEALER